MAGAGGEDDVVKPPSSYRTVEVSQTLPLFDVILGLEPKDLLHRLQMLGTRPSMTKDKMSPGGDDLRVMRTCHQVL
ncbi:hypothetical protein [Rhizobium sp. CIAT894]|uniref:hypothetical protein n=1 Tax=Rhizobium sp. CIAT894 TaxID=2020312 RepID=UPI000A1ED638|nr:hypothetical protein [Rhizobium sp. CIAT894]